MNAHGGDKPGEILLEGRKPGDKRPNREITVPLAYRRETKLRERERIVNLWKAETGCRVLLRGGRPVNTIATFEIFGTGANLNKAIAKVEDWIKTSKTKSAETTAWAKIPAHIPKTWYHSMLHAQTNERKEKYKGDIPANEELDYANIVVVDWPQDLRQDNIFPRDVFGTKLEALESIRTNDEVFIQLVGASQIQIRGTHPTNVDSAKEHLLTSIQKARTRLFNAVHPTYILLDDREECEVVWEKAEAWWPDQLLVPRLLPCGVNEPGVFRQEVLHPDQQSEIEQAFKKALEAIRYEKGSYELSVQYGCFALEIPEPWRHVGKKDAKENFMTGIRGLVKCAVKKWLIDDEGGDQLLTRLVAADHLLEPTKPVIGYGVIPDALADTCPTFRGTWVFKDPNAPRQPPTTSTNYVVQVDWTMNEYGLYEKDQIRYFRLGPGDARPKQHMDIKLLELGDSKAWDFTLQSMTHVRKTLAPTAICYFANQVRMDPKHDTKSKELFATSEMTPGLQMLTSRLDKIYTFGIKKTCYKVDMVAMWYPRQKVPCWGLRIYHSEWETHLVDLENLQQGRLAEWGDTLRAFLPDDGLTSFTGEEGQSDKDDNVSTNKPRCDGVRLLLNKMMELSYVINESGESSESGGIPIEDSAIPPSPHA